MWLLYLDESGVPEPHPSQTSHYVQLGLAVHESAWSLLDGLIRDVKRRFSVGNPDDMELHASTLRRPYEEQASIPDFDSLSWQARREAVLRVRRDQEQTRLPSLSGKDRGYLTRYWRQTDAFVHLTRDERERLVVESLAVAAGHSTDRLFLFGEAISKPHLSTTIEPVREAFTQLVTRFEFFLRKRRGEYGMLIVDYDRNKELRFVKLLSRFQRQGGPWADIDHVIEAPYFVESTTNAGIQLADLCSYALRRYLENQEGERFLPLLPRFYQTPTGLHGLRHFTRASCVCEICRRRGRAPTET